MPSISHERRGHRTAATLATLWVVLWAALAAAPAAAHGDQPHHGRAAVVKEQKPWGVAGDARAVRRTIEIRMLDSMRFVPDRLVVREGETVRLRIRNAGAVLHEFVLGTQADLDAHAAMMQKFPDMEHDEPYMVHVGPGRSGDIVWHFNRAGEFPFACLIAGHYQAGMVGRVVVQPRKTPAPAATDTPASKGNTR